MKRMYLLLAILGALTLTACGGETMADGTWTPVEDYVYQIDEAVGWPEEAEEDNAAVKAVRQAVDAGDYTMVRVMGNSAAYGTFYETAMMEGVTFANWDGEAVTPVYHFQDGIALTFQQFFNPGGTKAVLSWRPEEDFTTWNVRLVDMETGETCDLPLPAWDGETLCVFSRWADENTLRITAVEDLASGSRAAAWEYTLP